MIGALSVILLRLTYYLPSSIERKRRVEKIEPKIITKVPSVLLLEKSSTGAGIPPAPKSKKNKIGAGTTSESMMAVSSSLDHNKHRGSDAGLESKETSEKDSLMSEKGVFLAPSSTPLALRARASSVVKMKETAEDKRMAQNETEK